MPDPTAQINQNQPQQPTGATPPIKPVSPTPPPPSQMDNKKPPFFRISPLTVISSIFLILLLTITILVYLNNRKVADSNIEEIQPPEELFAVTPQPVSQESGGIGSLDESVICARFTNIEGALKYPDKACVLDLSGKKLNSLPKDISNLTKLSEINLSNNDFTTFPSELLNFDSLVLINLKNNQISTLPNEVFSSKSLQLIEVQGNPIKKRPHPTQQNPQPLLLKIDY